MGSLTPRATASASSSAAGFTLIEILVVLAIVGIASGAAWLAWRAGDDSPQREAHRFAGALEYAAQRAQWRREDLAVSAESGGWRFWRRDAERTGWMSVTDDDTLAAHALPDGLLLRAANHAGAALAADTLIPIRANGRNDPVSFVLDAGDMRLTIQTDPLNRVYVTAGTR